MTLLRTHRLPTLAGLALGLMVVAVVLIAYVAPVDADQGFSQKIFYFHVPVALTSYAMFGWGAWKALAHLWRRTAGADLESYVAIHQGVIFGAMTLLTGSVWAKISWGRWWTWRSHELVVFLILFLFSAAYFMLRFSVEPGARRANLSAVYALFGVVLIPMSFLAIRLSDDFLHPKPIVLKASGPDMSGEMFLAFCFAWAAMLTLGACLYHLELAGKRLDARLKELREVLAS